MTRVACCGGRRAQVAELARAGVLPAYVERRKAEEKDAAEVTPEKKEAAKE